MFYVESSLDPEYVADFLSYPTSSVSELSTSRTAYKGVQRVLPGWRLDVNTSTETAAVRPYWQWPSQAESTHSLERGGELILHLLQAAVRQRLGAHKTACHFSGGLDSTGLALLAERMEAQSGRKLLAVNLSYKRDPILKREIDYVNAALEGRSAIHLHPVAGDDLVYFSGYQRFPITDEPVALLASFESQEVLISVAAQQGADTILSGDGADHLFSPTTGALVAHEWQCGRFVGGLTLARAHAQRRGIPAWDILSSALGSSCQRLLSYRLTPGSGNRNVRFEHMTDLDIPPWVPKEFARTHRMHERLLSFRPPRFGGGLFSSRDIPSITGDWAHWNLAVPRGLAQLRPYWDSRVVSAALNLQPVLHYNPHRMKPVLSEAFKDLMPDKILYRRYKSNLNSQIVGFSKHLPWLQDVVEKTPIDFGELDRRVLLDCLRKVSLGVFADAPAVGRLSAAIGYMIWLADRPRWNATTATLRPIFP